MACMFVFQGILLVYDIANRWSFDGIDRWIKEIDEVFTSSIQWYFEITLLNLVATFS